MGRLSNVSEVWSVSRLVSGFIGLLLAVVACQPLEAEAQELRSYLTEVDILMEGASVVADQALEAGALTFESFCAVCHGSAGTGQGVLVGPLAIHPPDLTLLSQRAGGAFPVAMLERLLRQRARVVPIQTIQHGGDRMPLWSLAFARIDGSEALALARTFDVIAYLESIQR